MSIKEKIYIFGASNLGNKIFNLAKEYFNIIGFIDNDKNKWNTEFCGKKVYSPEILSNCKNKIFIASTFYKEIEEQLLENDFYNYFVILSESSFYSYLLINNYDVDKMIKDEYREFQEKISENNHNLQMISTSKKVLIIREMNSSLLNGLVSKLDANYIYIDILTRDNMSCYNNVKNIFKANDLFKMSLFLKNTNVYDIINIHYIHPYYYIFSDLIRSKCKKLVLSIWGSDFYAASKVDRQKQKKLIYISDVITFTNEITMEEFLRTFGENLREKCKICRFGLDLLDEINTLEKKCNIDIIKSELNIPKDKLIIVCGHSAAKNDNHLEIIKAIENISFKKDKLFLIFLMTYGKYDLEYIKRVENRLSKLSVPHIVLRDFISNKSLAKIRLVTDIFINILSTDQLNGALQESMYAGAIPIVGSWLPYDILKKYGCQLVEISDFKDLDLKLTYVLENIKKIMYKYKVNKQIIYRLSSWNNVIENWKNIYLNV